MFRVYTSSTQAAADGFGRVYQTVSTRVAGGGGQPSWVVKAALLSGLVIFLAVVALLVIPAVLIGAVVLLVLGGAWSLKQRLAAWLGRGTTPGSLRDPRRNVRVIGRGEGI